VTDYIKVLLHRRRDPAGAEGLEETPIWQWRQMHWMKRQNSRDRQNIIAAGINDPVMTALRLLHREAINRIPLLGQDDTVLHVLNHSSLLDFLMAHLADLLPSPDDEPLAGDTRTDEPPQEDDAAAIASASLQALFSYSVADLGIGSYGQDQPVVTLEMPVHEVLALLLNEHRYSLPIVDSQKGRRILDTFARNDVIRLEQGGVYNIEQPLGQAIADRNRLDNRLDVPVFHASDSLGAVASLMSTAGARTLYCIDEDGRVCGHLTVRQLFDWFMQYDEAP